VGGAGLEGENPWALQGCQRAKQQVSRIEPSLSMTTDKSHLSGQHWGDWKVSGRALIDIALFGLIKTRKWP